jgi:hypothetical protein
VTGPRIARFTTSPPLGLRHVTSTAIWHMSVRLALLWDDVAVVAEPKCVGIAVILSRVGGARSLSGRRVRELVSHFIAKLNGTFTSSAELGLETRSLSAPENVKSLVS